MKGVHGFLVPLVGLASVVSGSGSVVAGGLSPVTRVVELLQNLGKKIEEEVKAEENLFENFECWAKSVVSQKTASNTAATSRKESLTTYVADLDAGRIELTSERVDLEKEIEGLREDIEQAEGLRAKEKADFEAAKAEMQQAITALGKAVDVMDAGAKPASLLRLRSNINGQLGDSIQAREADAQGLTLVLEIARNSLSKADAMFLQRVLTAEVPVKDWKKLNRKADFKEKYVARSGDIQKTLTGLLEQFKSSLGDATAKEKKGAELHEKLMGAKGDQKSKAEGALSAMEVEGAARGLSKSEAQGENEALGKQIESDAKYLKDTQSALATKTEEWKDRKQIRTDEIAAIGKAISILYSDDARDVMKKSLKSQGYSLVQDKRRSASIHAVKVQTGAGGRFDKVIESIDKMVVALKAEEGSDLTRKEGCESARAEDTRSGILLARAMDELSDAATRLASEIEELNGQIKEKAEEISSINASLTDAEHIRADENAEWQRSDADDRNAALLVGEAVGVLETFYNSLALAQRGVAHSKQPVEGMAAGQAPPPPPSTWATPYGGKKDENQGVVGILGLIKMDIEADMAKAKEEEDASGQAYEKFKTENLGLIAQLHTAIAELEGTVGTKEGEVQDNHQDRLTKKSELEAVMLKIKEAAPGCDFFAVNFHARLEKRTNEVDGLQKAKQVLQGASFQ
mmetsp:Transcript_47597/g.120594  ORF Transcript_47597/g.120594 Transcript_47597/m.120594 type:complete len:689 (+) Transcript_47597:55-2121(+)